MVLGAPAPFLMFDWAPQDGTLIHLVRLDGSEVSWEGAGRSNLWVVR